MKILNTPNRKSSFFSRRTKIITTLGPASNDISMIEKFIRTGIDCVRLNFSHGTPEEHVRVMNQVRTASRQTGKLVAIMQDLPGPKIRVGDLKGGLRRLMEGSNVILASAPIADDENAIPVQLKDLPRYVKVGGSIYLSDGLIKLRVLATKKTAIECKCEVGGVLLSGKGVNIPDLKHDFESFTEKDKRYLARGLQESVDLVAISFVMKASDIEKVRRFTQKKGGNPLLVAKIEKKEAIENISEIIDVSDAVMIARGDLGIENPIEDVPGLQKTIIARCRSKGVPVITATQMLESMVSNAIPTRAEVTDVANAIFDGTDAVMLSEETALGKYPLECVQIMNRVIRKAEERMFSDQTMKALDHVDTNDLTDTFSAAAYQISQNRGAAAIVIQSNDEKILPKISRFRPRAVIIHMANDENILRRSKLIWGVYQSRFEVMRDSTLDNSFLQNLLSENLLEEGNEAVVIRGVDREDKRLGFSLSVAVAGEGIITRSRKIRHETA